MSRPHLVLKFGGTSLSSSARVRRAARRVLAHIARGIAPVVVVSATGGSTDRVLRRIGSLSGGPASLSPREVDRALATGEDLAGALLAAALSGIGVPSRSLRGGEAGIRAAGSFGHGVIWEVDPSTIRSLTVGGVVPVISGFQATDSRGETLTLGRGGSDITAVAIAASLGSVPCHIVTDVSAVHDLDPRVEADAVPLREMTCQELLDLVEGGARVVHPAAASLAAKKGVTLRVYHHAVRPGREGGTLVLPAPARLELIV
ncbi:MAG: hypothetical protein H0U67_03555 [Gemmatimonadetes bacterium]|nr:hypothetical protein [Gemmatimonadota bacterium]